VRKAYFAMAKSLHPDRVGRLGLTELKPQATKLFQLVTEAYNTLSDPQRRKDYATGKTKAATPSASVAAQAVTASANVEAAKIAYHKGSVMMQKRAYGEAEQHFREATEANDKMARYWQSLGWAIFNNEEGRSDAQRLEAAKKAYEKALELDENDAQTHYSIGLYWKAQGDTKKMRKAMEKAVQGDPNNINAKRELRLLKMREDKDKGVAAKGGGGSGGKPSGAGAGGKPPSSGGGGFFANLWQQLTKKR
jgi:tetratricopeptide (TPR) repeat protein